MKLLADGAYTGKSEVLSEGSGWTSSFTDLDEYRNGKKINYSVEEESVAGYQTVISGDAESGFTITNAHTPSEPHPSDDVPDTGSNANLPFWLLFSMTGLMGTILVFRKKEQDA